ncbi:MAG: mandelate racemase/muconate lactonizing enzyme family protein [Burkholderiaceae bacterium]|nr:mandelate racemase/muconate lactonizing enzyme family protein [Burkholderiaceae bacterium]
MKIAHCEAIPLNVEIELAAAGVTRRTNLSCVLVKLEADDGTIGTGFTAITEEEVVAAAIDQVAADAVIGMDPMAHERIWDKLYWLLAPRGQSGYAMHAIAAIDLAVWDLKARALKQPIWRLLGAARQRVPVYATFGFGFFDREQLVDAARACVAQGFRRLKMTVGNHALQRRDEPRPLADVIAEDERRVRAVREAVGPQVELCIDANCSLDAYHAHRLAHKLDDVGLAFFEEPVTHNDVRALADLRSRVRVPIAAGQNEGLASRFVDFFEARALDIAQPNVAITGGITQCLRIAGTAQSYNVAIANGGAWPFHNMHLHAGLAHGGFVEYHRAAVSMCEQIYRAIPGARDGCLELGDAPGFGFDPDWDAVRTLARRPLSRGSGKA